MDLDLHRILGHNHFVKPHIGDVIESLKSTWDNFPWRSWIDMQLTKETWTGWTGPVENREQE